MNAVDGAGAEVSPASVMATHLRLNWRHHELPSGSREYTAFSTPHMIKHGMGAVMHGKRGSWWWQIKVRGREQSGTSDDLLCGRRCVYAALIKEGHPDTAGCPYDVLGARTCNICFRDGGCPFHA